MSKIHCGTCTCQAGPLDIIRANYPQWSDRDLAEWLGVTPEHFSRWSTGRSEIPRTVKIIASFIEHGSDGDPE